MNEFYIEGLLTAKFIPSIFFCQQILLGLKNNVLNNWRVMVKIRPSTEEIEMHDLYSTDYERMISTKSKIPKGLTTQTQIDILWNVRKSLLLVQKTDLDCPIVSKKTKAPSKIWLQLDIKCLEFIII